MNIQLSNLAIELIRGEQGDGPLLAREPVLPSDLGLSCDETWLRGMRAGQLPTDLTELTAAVLPGDNLRANQVDGYRMELSDGGGRSYRRHFPTKTLEHVAARPLKKLLQQKTLQVDDEYTYVLASIPDAEIARDVKPAMQAKQRSEPLLIEKASLAELMESSELMPGVLTALLETAEAEDPPMPVFVPQEVWEESHEQARRGGEDESAGVWIGRLLRDVDSPELMLLLDACLEVEQAEEEKFSVQFSGESWRIVRERLELRRRRLKRPNEMIVGSVHGHNFQPEADSTGNRKCANCAVAEICSRTTAVASGADLNWHRTCFARQPWSVLTLWGWNARDEEEWRHYGLSGATLTPRNLRVLKS